ncbi:MAG: hypothetical protein WC214_04045 [Candidatus Omnitrophota bacterium]
MKKKRIHKQAWQKPELIKIRLNSEQAVLSCCDNSGRAMQYGSMGSFKCVATAYMNCGSGSSSPSS